MKIEITMPDKNQQRYLSAIEVLRYLEGKSEELDKMIIYSGESNIHTTDQDLYQAIGSMESLDGTAKGRLVKLLEIVDVESLRHKGITKKVLTDGRVLELRKALEEQNE